jgi:tetratricopeptide (TPR) repeat protein
MRLSKITAVAALACVLAGIAFAQQPAPAAGGGEKDKEKEKGRSGATVDPATGKALNAAVEQINAGKYNEAKATLGKMSLDRLSPYEQSRVHQLSAAVEQGLGRYGPARDHLAKAIASGGLNDQEANAARFQIAQFFMAEDKWKEGVDALKQWFAATPNPNSAAYHLLAVAYYQLGNYGAALEPAQKAIDMSGGHPQESWLQLLLALRLEREEYSLAVPILRHLVDAAPQKKTYWLQLSAVHAQLGAFDQAAVPLQLAYYGGLLTDQQDIERLSQILMRIGIPYRAGQLLGEAISKNKVPATAKSYELLANCWVAAREYEKSIDPLRKAANLSDSGELYLRLAEVYVQKEDWGNASESLRAALAKGKIKNVGAAQLLMGIASYNQKKVDEAQTWFERARGSGEHRQSADGWLAHIESERQAKADAAAAAAPQPTPTPIGQ